VFLILVWLPDGIKIVELKKIVKRKELQLDRVLEEALKFLE
jgi:L-rhamnose isomerase